MTHQRHLSAASRAAVWAALPAASPGIDAFALTAAVRLTEVFVRATLQDFMRCRAIRCAKFAYTSGRNRRERTQYWRAVAVLPTFQEAQAMQGRKTRRCLSCREDFSSWGAGNRICQKCSGRDDPLPDVFLPGMGARW